MYHERPVRRAVTGEDLRGIQQPLSKHRDTVAPSLKRNDLLCGLCASVVISYPVLSPRRILNGRSHFRYPFVFLHIPALFGRPAAEHSLPEPPHRKPSSRGCPTEAVTITTTCIPARRSHKSPISNLESIVVTVTTTCGRGPFLRASTPRSITLRWPLSCRL